MKSFKLRHLVFALVCSASMVGIAVADDQTTTTTTDATAVTAPQASNQKATQDQNIVAFMMALNQNEINAANAASKKQINAKVTDFATMMQKDHQKNLDAITDLSKTQNITPMDNASVNKLKENGEKELTKLSSLDGNQFDNAFIKAMISGHLAALNHINQFLKTTKNDALKTYLTDTKQAVQMHLTEAMKVQKELKDTKQA